VSDPVDDDAQDDELKKWRDGVPVVPAPDPEVALGEEWHALEDATPADDLVAAVEEGALDVAIAPGADRAGLREFLERGGGELGSHP
jgi:hypothetical protein